MTTSAPRIAIYGTGTVGQIVTRLACDAGWEVVAAYNRAGDKVGHDLGELAGLGQRLGVIVEDADKADFSKLRADIGVVATTDRLEWNLPAYERLFSADVNVLCHGAESYHPHQANPELAARIDALARQHAVTFSGSGIWDATRIWSGLLAAGPCVSLTALHHSSLTDNVRQGVHLMRVTGTGMTQQEFADAIAKTGAKTRNMYTGALAAVLDRLGFTVTDVEERREPILYDRPFYCPALNEFLEPGTVVGTRFVARVDSAEGVFATGSIELRPFEEGDVEETCWSIQGRPRMEVRFKREDSDIASASSLFNRIPAVIAAEPGIVDLTRLGPPIPPITAATVRLATTETPE